MSVHQYKDKAFTLIELLIVIAIIAILSIVVVLTLSPAEMLRQSRDQNRLSDMDTLTHALSLYQTDQAILSNGGSFGTINTVYVSLPDPQATTTAGSTCASLNLPILPSGSTYHCAGPNYYRTVNGQGWIPVNFSSVSTGSPLGQLPIDPTNTSSSRLYYTYVTNGSQYEVTAVMESAKYELGGTNDQIANDGGTLASVYEKGSKLGLEPLDYGDSSLVGLWTMDGNANDMSGDGYNMSAPNGVTWMSSTSCKVNTCAFLASSTNQYLYVTNATSVSTGVGSFTYSAWVNPTRRYDNLGFAFFGNYQYPSGQSGNIVFEIADNSTVAYITQPSGPGGSCGFDYTSLFSSWHFVSIVKQSNTFYIYLDGTQIKSCDASTVNVQLGGGAWFAGNGHWRSTDMFIDDLRVYNRALSAAEVAALYGGGK